MEKYMVIIVIITVIIIHVANCQDDGRQNEHDKTKTFCDSKYKTRSINQSINAWVIPEIIYTLPWGASCNYKGEGVSLDWNCEGMEGWVQL